MLLKFLILTQTCADTVLIMPIYMEIETRAFISNRHILLFSREAYLHTHKYTQLTKMFTFHISLDYHNKPQVWRPVIIITTFIS